MNPIFTGISSLRNVQGDTFLRISTEELDTEIDVNGSSI
jgi:hypothetical protein